MLYPAMVSLTFTAGLFNNGAFDDAKIGNVMEI